MSEEGEGGRCNVGGHARRAPCITSSRVHHGSMSIHHPPELPLCDNRRTLGGQPDGSWRARVVLLIDFYLFSVDESRD